MKNSIKLGHPAVMSEEKKCKSGYIALLNQKQKFVVIIVLFVLENDSAKP